MYLDIQYTLSMEKEMEMLIDTTMDDIYGPLLIMVEERYNTSKM